MFESFCSELLLSGLLYVSNKNMDHIQYNDTYVTYSQSNFVVPDNMNLALTNCQKEVFVKKVENMKSLVSQTN